MSQKHNKLETCPVRKALSILGGKWVVLILVELKEPKRYGQIKKAIPDVSEKVLIAKLRLLEENNLVTRTDHKTIPPRVDYALTSIGEKIFDIVPVLTDIGKKCILPQK